MLGMSVVSNSHMYPWLFKCWDCSWEGDNDTDNETIAVGINNNKT